MSMLTTWQAGKKSETCRLVASISVSENSLAGAVGLLIFSRTVYRYTNDRGIVDVLINHYPSKHKTVLSTHQYLRSVS